MVTMGPLRLKRDPTASRLELGVLAGCSASSLGRRVSMFVDCAQQGESRRRVPVAELGGRSAPQVGVHSGAAGGPLRLRLIGPPAVEIDGEVLTHQQQSLVAFIALCGPVSGDDIALALWQGRVMSANRLFNLLSETRRVVGRHRLPSSSDGYYRLFDYTSDVDRVEALCQPMTADGSQWLEEASRAIAELEGQPLTRSARAGRTYWTWLEQCLVRRAHIERQIGQLILSYTARTGSAAPEVAVRALEQGLRAIPDDVAVQQELLSRYQSMGFSASARTLMRVLDETAGEALVMDR